MSADFTPSLNTYTDLTPFRFWCQKILPIAYDDSLSYYELLCKVVDYLNKTMEDVELSIEDVEKLHDAYEDLQEYVNDYFTNLDVQEEINNKLDVLVANGTIHQIFSPDVMAILTQAQAATQQAINNIPTVVGTWLSQHVSPETGYVIDDSLSTPNAAADALATGVADSNIKSAVELAFFGEIEDDDFVQGYRTQEDYYTVHNQTIRCTSAKYYHVYPGDTITIYNIAEGTKSAILGAGKTSATNYDSGWKTADFTYTAVNELIVFIEVAKSDDTADILVSDVSTVFTLVDKSTRITDNENAIGELKSELNELEVDSANGKANLIHIGKYYDGYYSSSAYTGTSTEISPSAAWCTVLIPVIEGKTITISNMAHGGVNSAWLNSNDLTDINTLFGAANNDGTKVCKTNWLALCVYNAKANQSTYRVMVDYVDMLEDKIESVDDKYGTLEAIERNVNQAITDNLFSNHAEDWSKGQRPGNTDGYAVHLPLIAITSGDYNIFVDKDNDLTGSLTIAFYVDGSYSSTLSYVSGTAITRDFSSYSHISIGFSTQNSSISANIDEILKKIRVYIGHSPILTLEKLYPKYIPKYAEKAYVMEEPIADGINQKLFGDNSDFDLSGNWFSNFDGDWEREYHYRVVLKNDIIVDEYHDSYSTYVNLDALPTVLRQHGTLTIQKKNANNETIGTNYHSLTGTTYCYHRLQIPSATVKLHIYVALDTTDLSITPSDIVQMKAYIGYEDHCSLITKMYDPASKYIVNQSRTVMKGGYLPDYWLNYMLVKGEELFAKNELIGAKGFSFAFFTDQHWPSNYQKSPLLMKWIKDNTPVNRFVNGGDILTEHSTLQDALNWTRSFVKAVDGLNMRSIRGNHDNNTMQNDATAFLGTGRYYADLVRPVENDIVVEDGHTYFYEKIEAQKVIIFYLDTGDMVTSGLINFDAQIEWMSDIVSTLDSEWSILVVQHIVFDGVDENNVPIIYTTGQKTITYLNSVENCNVIGIICGHTHKDYSLMTDGGYPVIVTTCDAAGGQTTNSGLTRTEGTILEQAFDVFHISTDPENKTIYATRIGAGSDRSFSYGT